MLLSGRKKKITNTRDLQFQNVLLQYPDQQKKSRISENWTGGKKIDYIYKIKLLNS